MNETVEQLIARAEKAKTLATLLSDLIDAKEVVPSAYMIWNLAMNETVEQLIARAEKAKTLATLLSDLIDAKEVVPSAYMIFRATSASGEFFAQSVLREVVRRGLDAYIAEVHAKLEALLQWSDDEDQGVEEPGCGSGSGCDSGARPE